MAHILTDLGASQQRPLIAVFSCVKDRKWHQLARDTWLKNCSVDYAFFLGGSAIPISIDERIVDAPDDRPNLFRKTKRIVEYAVNENYSHLFKLDIDTYCHIPRLLKSGFEKYDWVGYGEPYGGSGYWLSHKAMVALLENNVDYPTLESEDSWVARNLKNLNLVPYSDPRYHSITNEGPQEGNNIITSHWYSEHSTNGERIISFEERISLIPGYHERATQIRDGENQ